MGKYVIKGSRYAKGAFDKEGVFCFDDGGPHTFVGARPEFPAWVNVPDGHKVDEDMIPTDEATLAKKKEWRKKHEDIAAKAAASPHKGAAPTKNTVSLDEIYVNIAPKPHFAEKAEHPMSAPAVQNPPVVQSFHGKSKSKGRFSDDEPI